MTAEQFKRHYRRLLLVAWILPPAVGMSFLVFVDIFTLDQMKAILLSPIPHIYAIAVLLLSLFFLERYIWPVVAVMQGVSTRVELAFKRLRGFPLAFWSALLLSIGLAPMMMIFAADQVLGYEATPVIWFRIHLTALIVSIIIGLPIFFRLLDLFGRILTDYSLGRPHLTVGAKVFLIGALMPLLIDTILIQYYWARTGFFTGETFLIWLLLEAIAIGGSLIFVDSFGQSLRPLQRFSGLGNAALLPQLQRTSTDELGVLTDGIRSLINEREQAQRQVADSERDLQGILDNMQDIYYRTDATGVLLRVTPSVKRILGYDPDAVLGTYITDYYVDPDERAQMLIELQKNGGRVSDFRAALRHQDGTPIWFSTNLQYYRDEHGQIAGVEGIARDVTDLIDAREQVHSEREHAMVTLRAVGDAVITTDVHDKILFTNPMAERLLGYSSSELEGALAGEAIQIEGAPEHESLEGILRRAREDGRTQRVNNILLLRGEERESIVNIVVSPLREHGGAISGAAIILHDITEVMGITRQLNYQATHDMLTGLCNRTEFENRLLRAIRDARRERHQHALCYMDLDQFKVVNDSAGHHAGDELLIQLSALLQRQVRDTDVLARLGGDEFGLLLYNCPLERAQQVADNLRKVVKAFRFVHQERSYEIGISVGVVPIDLSFEQLGEVLRAADAACYVAKELGRNRVHVYEPDDSEVAQHHGQMEWVHRITDAFEENRIELHGQLIAPVVRHPDETPHYEVLIRIRESGRLISPMAFIPAAERYNLMPTIDRWVVRTTLGMMRQAQGPNEFPPVTCSINLSGQSLNDDSFLDFVIDQFDETGVPHEAVCFEITETAAISHLSRAMRFMSVLRGVGCKFALDDFGSGLSSFGYLKNLTVDYLKIDGSFIHQMLDDSADRAMVGSINHIGHVLGLQTVAEYVEDEETLHALEVMGVDYVQGFSVGEVFPLAEILSL